MEKTEQLLGKTEGRFFSLGKGFETRDLLYPIAQQSIVQFQFIVLTER